MKTRIRLLVCSLFLAAPVLVARGTADAPLQGATGRVLLLINDRALEGDIRRDGDQYCVRRAVGEVWLPADCVRQVCASWEEAFASLRAQANLRDPDERLRLARWCLGYGLREQALDEATAAVQMRPGHAASRQLLALVQRPVAASDIKPPAPPPPEAELPTAPPPAIDLSAEALGVFTARVQPVLMNTCASCHAGGKGGAFKLCRPSASSAVSRRATQQNLAAVLPLIDPARPQLSPLLLRAITDHGRAGQAPVKAQSPPYRVLQDWIELTLATNPFLRTHPSLAAEAPLPAATRGRQYPEETLPQAPRADAPSSPAQKTAPVVSQPMLATTNPAAPGTTPPPAAQASAPPADEFDPAIFNRQAHPPQPHPQR
jgi:hypothetical protein